MVPVCRWPSANEFADVFDTHNCIGCCERVEMGLWLYCCQCSGQHFSWELATRQLTCEFWLRSDMACGGECCVELLGLRYLVRQAGPPWLVASVGTVGMSFVCLCVHVANGTGASMAVRGVCCGQIMSNFKARYGLGMYTLRAWCGLGMYTLGALYGLGTSTLGGWYGLLMYTLRDGVTGSGRYFFLTYTWEEWRWIRLWDAVARRLKLCMVVLPFPLAIPITVHWRFSIEWKTWLACVMVGFVILFCWNTIVLDTHYAFF